MSFASVKRDSAHPLREDLHANLDGLTTHVHGLLQLFFPDDDVSRDSLKGLLLTALRLSDDEYAAEEALEWAGDFSFPPGISDRDATTLQSNNFNLAKVAEERQAHLAQTGRLCPDRVRSVVPADDPDFGTLLTFATEGVPVITDPAFIPNGAPPPLRTKYVKMAPVVNKLMLDLFHSGLIIIIPTELALKIEGIHFSSTHWALKKGKIWGRPIGDASCDTGNGHSLNGPWVKSQVDTLWGPIQHPTVDRLASMVLAQAARYGWDNLVLWKMDLKGAFTLLFVAPDSVCRLAFALTDGLTMFYHTGMFGWTGMPGAFDVVTLLVVRRLVQRSIRGECDMYVDDLVGACSKEDLHHDLQAACSICESLLGPDSVEHRKTEHGRRLDLIGWVFDLDLRSVSISHRNFMKTFSGFLSASQMTTIPVRFLERLASWASRYGMICRPLRPFTHELYSAQRLASREGSVHKSRDLTAVIDLWLATLVRLELHRAELSRPLDSIVMRSPTWHLDFDASLTGIEF